MIFRLRRIWFSVFHFAFSVFLLILVSAPFVRGYEAQYADDAKKTPLRWRGTTINLALSNSLRQNPNNVKSGGEIVAAVRSSLRTWEAAANIKFVTTWTDKVSISAADGKGDGTSLITIAATPENVLPFQAEAAEMPGRTRVFFNRRGEITEADIVLNPYQQFTTDGSIGTFDFEAALTHEIGHLLGLDHSAIMAATMYARQGKNGTFSLPAFAPRSLSADDRAGVRSLYGAQIEDENCCGTISGAISDFQSKPHQSWLIWAEEISSGRIFASASTDEKGAFTIAGLPAGKFRIVAQTDNLSAEILGEMTVENDKIAILNRKFSPRIRHFKPILVGYNGQLSALAVPLSLSNQAQTLFIGGENLHSENSTVLETASPFLQIVESTLAAQDFDAQFPVYSFQLLANWDAPAGEYSLRWQNSAGETAYLPGCFSIGDKQ